MFGWAKKAVPIVVGLITMVCVKIWFEQSHRNDMIAARDQAMIKTLTQLNSTAPNMIDEYTRFDRAEYVSGSRMVYYYSFPAVSKTNVDSTALAGELKKSASEFICAKQESKAFFSSGLFYSFIYRDSKAADLASFDIRNTDCTHL